MMHVCLDLRHLARSVVFIGAVHQPGASRVIIDYRQSFGEVADPRVTQARAGSGR
jgi:hypothetical protein